MTNQVTPSLKGTRSKINRERFFALFILFVALIGFFNAFRFGGASLDYYLVRNAIDAWQVNARIQTQEEFNQARSAIQTANILHRSNPLYIDLSGQIKEWGAVSGFDERDGLLLAKANYLQATKIRPLWPVTWANLAMVKWRLQEFDEEMLGYLRKANELGSQTIEVHILFSRIGISLYAANNPMYIDIKEIVHARLGLGLRNSFSRAPIVSFIKSTESLSVVCRWMDETNKYTAQKHLSCPE
jgi:hypothetical protein